VGTPCTCSNVPDPARVPDTGKPVARAPGPGLSSGAWQPGSVSEDTTPAGTGSPDAPDTRNAPDAPRATGQHGPDVGTSPRPLVLVALVGAVLLEAGLLAGLAGFYVVGTLGGRATDVPVAVATAALALVLAGALGLFARGLWARRRWARAPLITWNLLVVLSLVSSGGWRTPFGLVVLVASVAVVVGLFSPAVTRATTPHADPPVT